MIGKVGGIARVDVTQVHLERIEAPQHPNHSERKYDWRKKFELELVLRLLMVTLKNRSHIKIIEKMKITMDACGWWCSRNKRI